MAETSVVLPTPAVIGVVVRDGQVLLVRRSNPPDAGKWGFPGRKIEGARPFTRRRHEKSRRKPACWCVREKC